MTSAYPLAWPEGWKRTPDFKRKASSPFATTFDRARKAILNELRLLGATNVVVSSWLPLHNDGQPYAEAARRKLEDPGVAVYFTLRGNQMTMARDAYSSVHDNLRSLGLAIEHLRGLERHGGATMMERAFQGFTAIAANPGQRAWWAVLDLPRTATAAQIEVAFRSLAKSKHPDAAGGSTNAMSELNAARDAALKEIDNAR